jgi:hypothetical protein
VPQSLAENRRRLFYFKQPNFKLQRLMLSLLTERRAVHETALMFNDFGWVFREQSISDFGIDAFVETTIEGRPNGNFMALQIKGGESNFHRNKNGLTFYLDSAHKDYWLEVGKTFLVLLILQSTKDGEIYWEVIDTDTIIKAVKNWKIIVPLQNVLSKKSKKEIEKLIKAHTESTSYSDRYIHLAKEGKPLGIQVSFGCDSNGIHCMVKYGSKKGKLVLNYKPRKDYWDSKNHELKWDSPYCYTLYEIERFIKSSVASATGKMGKIEILDSTIGLLNRLAKAGGIRKIDEFLFDKNNGKDGIPKYSSFIGAFEFYKNIGGDKYEVQTVDHVMYFRIGEDKYVVDTYAGKTKELKSFIDRKSYSEIYTQTNENIWSEIYLDAGIEKAVFIPEMLVHWEDYWNELYKRIQDEVGSTDHLDQSKERSWRQFQIFSEGYDDVGDIIKYAFALDDMELYPMAVVSMMNLFNPDVCYSEYCEFEFENGEWETIREDNDDEDAPIFYIQKSDM